MTALKFDPAERGLKKNLREYEEIALRHIWAVGDEGANSREAWEQTNIKLGEGRSISRASVIFFLDRMVDQGVLGFRDATGKGGHHKIYVPELDEGGYERYVVRTLLESVMRDFPEETTEVVNSFKF